MSKLREQMIRDLEFARRSESTKRHYTNSIRNLAKHYGRCPSKLSPDEIRAWVRLLRSSGIKEDRLRQHLAALKFLYCKTLGRSEMVAFLSFRRRRRNSPPSCQWIRSSDCSGHSSTPNTASCLRPCMPLGFELVKPFY